MRNSKSRVWVRHHTTDIHALDEIFAQLPYAPPIEVEQTLAARARPLKVADLGANVGLFGVFVRERFDVGQIVGFEPDPDNFAVLERCVASNADSGAWQVIEACAAAGEGSRQFAAGHGATSHQVEPWQRDTGRTVRAVDAFPLIVEADLVKIDIEGGEWELLDDARLSGLGAAALALEYHGHLCPAPEPESHARERLRAAGFEVGLPFMVRERERVGMLWAWRPLAGARPFQ